MSKLKWRKDKTYFNRHHRVYKTNAIPVLSSASSESSQIIGMASVSANYKHAYVQVYYLTTWPTYTSFGRSISHHLEGTNSTQKAMRWAEYMLENPVDYVNDLDDNHCRNIYEVFGLKQKPPLPTPRGITESEEPRSAAGTDANQSIKGGKQ